MGVKIGANGRDGRARGWVNTSVILSPAVDGVEIALLDLSPK